MVKLKPHPGTPSPWIDGIEVEFERDGLLLWLRFTAIGDPSAIAWPAEAGRGRADDLWRHTCFEAFVVSEESHALAWREIAELAQEETADASVRRMAQKWLHL